jgi:hypothetical protein
VRQALLVYNNVNMTTFINGPDRYHAIASQDPHILSDMDPYSEEFVLHEGLHRREAILPYVNTFRSQLAVGDPKASLQGYQYWAELAWKTPHGTYDSVDRFGEKAIEEFTELSVEYVNYRKAERSKADLQDQSYIDVRKRLIDELGNAAFCITALASNSGAGLDAGAKRTFYDYVMSINHTDSNGKDMKPAWHDVLAPLATKYELLTLEDVDTAITAGLEPTYMTVINMPNPEEEWHSIGDYIQMMLTDAYILRGIAENQYNYGETNDDCSKSTVYVMPEVHRALANQISDNAVRTLLRLAYVTRRTLRIPFTDVIEANITKIDQRVELGQADKTDNPRTVQN